MLSQDCFHPHTRTRISSLPHFQATSLFNTEITLADYLDKSFYKTASLIAASCRSAAVLRCVRSRARPT